MWNTNKFLLNERYASDQLKRGREMGVARKKERERGREREKRRADKR